MSGSVVAASLFASTALAIAKLPDLDNSASFPPPMLHLAQTARFYTVKIAPGSLNDALVQLGEQTGLRISFDTQTVDGLTTAGLTGRLTSRRALTLLLRSTGLRTRRLSGAGVVIVPPPVTVAQAVELPGIIVIGDKEQRSVFDTVNSVGVATSEDIDNSTVFSTNDVLNQIPNVTTYNGGEDISIRGVRADSPSGRNEATSAPVITVYRDGAPLSEFGRAVGPQSLWDVAQIEVLRGSQSTEQGRNSLGGAVYIKTNDPVFTNQTATRFGAGTQGTIVASAMANGVIVPGVLAVRLVADAQTTDGFNRNPVLGIDDQAEKSERTVRAKIRFDPKLFDGWTNILTASFSRNTSGDDVVDKTDPDARLFFGNVQGFENVDQSIVALDSKVNLAGPWKIHNIITWNRADYDRVSDFNGSLAALNHVIAGTTFPAGLNNIGNPEISPRENLTTTFTEEFRLKYDGERLKAFAGLYYARIKSEESVRLVGGVDVLDQLTAAQQAAISPLILGGFYPGRLSIGPAPNLRNGFETEEENFALFGKVNFDVTNYLNVFGGLRYDRVEQRRGVFSSTTVTNLPEANTGIPPIDAGITTANNVVLSSPALNSTSESGTTVSEAYLPSGGLTLKLNQDLNLSGLVKRGYRAGGGAASTILGVPFTFDPEFVTNYEIALRARTPDRAWSITGNAFYSDWTDMQVSNTTLVNGLTDRIIENAGKAELYGFEAAVRGQPTEELGLFASVGYVKTRFIEFESNGRDFADNEFPFAPNWTASVGAIYKFPNGVFIQSDANYQSAAFSDAQNSQDEKLDERLIVNAKIGYDTDGLTVYAYGTNIFDELYLTSNSSVDVPGNPSANFVKTGDGRAFGIRVKAKLQ